MRVGCGRGRFFRAVPEAAARGRRCFASTRARICPYGCNRPRCRGIRWPSRDGSWRPPWSAVAVIASRAFGPRGRDSCYLDAAGTRARLGDREGLMPAKRRDHRPVQGSGRHEREPVATSLDARARCRPTDRATAASDGLGRGRVYRAMLLSMANIGHRRPEHKQGQRKPEAAHEALLPARCAAPGRLRSITQSYHGCIPGTRLIPARPPLPQRDVPAVPSAGTRSGAPARPPAARSVR